MIQKHARLTAALAGIALGALPGAQEVRAEPPRERPSAEAMVVDALVSRPANFVATVLGAGAFIVTLPFSALGGNVDEAAEVLVADPARRTFGAPLGELRREHPYAPR